MRINGPGRAPLLLLFMSFAVSVVPPIALLASGPPSENTPPWETDFIVWPRNAGQPTPWRADARLAGRFARGFPDDVSVFFDNPDPAVRDEMMWVTVIDYHSASDRYLGVLLNAPFNLTTVKERDNIVFRYDSDSSELRALTAAGRYDFVGIPQRAQSGALAQVWEGVRQYRLGNYGHDQEAIKSCIATLSTATPLLEQSVAPADRYLAHFVLGRCHAEAYNTDLAIENFRKAISYRATDVDAHMALLAEYSLKVHPPVDQPKELHDDRWEPLFIEQLKYVREHFHADAMVGTATTIIFDESEISDLSELSAEEIARRRKVGFGVFRWKRH